MRRSSAWSRRAQLARSPASAGSRRCLAALIAVTQTDLKRVLAYSTISQLGYMFLALGSGIHHDEHHLASVAVTAAIFHLFTHAFFKALLFLAAGSVMHAMGDVIDMRQFSGLRKALPITHWTFLCGAPSALAGIPPGCRAFGARTKSLPEGNFSAWKHAEPAMQAIYGLLVLQPAPLDGRADGVLHLPRAYFMTFWGEEKLPAEAGHHPHEAAADHGLAAAHSRGRGAHRRRHRPWAFPWTHLRSPIFSMRPVDQAAVRRVSERGGARGGNFLLMLVSSVIALAGIGIAYWMYVVQPSAAGGPRAQRMGTAV